MKILNMHRELIIKTIVRLKHAISKMEEQLDEIDNMPAKITSVLSKEDMENDRNPSAE